MFFMFLVALPAGSGTGFGKLSPFRATQTSNAGRAPRILLSSSPPGDLGALFWLGFGRLPTYRAESDRFEEKIWEGSLAITF